ncbi:MAG: hypothetical protein H0T89_21965 [Deltaproteobacteria bacterium]|nr:hypothetical protein [Deltaproteobacteria bacterium]MDQ3297824.1 hypothetical protein [Myxococcota bacterium]
MRSCLVIASLVGLAATARADTPAYRIVEDGALGMELPADRRVLDEAKAAGPIAACLAATPPGGSALFWVDVGKQGVATRARVAGTGKPALDACLGKALAKLTTAEKLTAAVAIVGRIDLLEPGTTSYLASPRISSAAVVIDAKGAPWQVTVNRIGYTSNRAQDIAGALDGRNTAIAACAKLRGKTAQPAAALAWIDGKQAVVQSGNRGYDSCIAKALDGVKLPAPDSAMWMQLAIGKPAEPLAPRTDVAGLTKADLLRDALTTAVRSRKELLLGCTDGKPKATLTKVGVALRGGKASVYKVTTGDTGADACVRNKFRDIAISSAAAGDKVELEVMLEPPME